MVSFIVLADRRSSLPGNTSENGALSWINMADSLGVGEISSQHNEQRSHGTTELKVEKTACRQRGIGPRKPGKLPDPMKNNYGKKKKGDER